MITVSSVKERLKNLVVRSDPIFEPINAPEILRNKIGRFDPAIYNLGPDSHLLRFLSALCGDAGAGGLRKRLLYTRLQQFLNGTHFLDLDRLYGEPLALPRLSAEIYDADPSHDALTAELWRDIILADASYRNRCEKWMRAIKHGPTKRGIELAAEAACGYDCEVFERYIWLSNEVADEPTNVANLGLTNSPQEFVIVVQAPEITLEEQRRIVNLVDRIKPADTLVTVTIADGARKERGIIAYGSSSSSGIVLRNVRGRDDVIWPDPDRGKGFWIEAGVFKEAPTHAFMLNYDATTFPTITTAEASSTHIGYFSKTQAGIFNHLNAIENEIDHKQASYAHTEAPAPLNIESRWIVRDSSSGVVVNHHYPLEYFTLVDIEQSYSPPKPSRYWASMEATAEDRPEEYLILDMGRERPINMLQMEIPRKPYTLSFFWSTDKISWDPLFTRRGYDSSRFITYKPGDNPWFHYEEAFETVTARYVKIVYTKRSDAFPLLNTPAFPWSIETRNLRLVYNVFSTDDFVSDTGVDILGNEFTTEILPLDADQALDGGDYWWQSQVNPERDAVEALYFDVRPRTDPGTMSALANFYVGELNGVTMLGLTNINRTQRIIDEIFIDPITPSVVMNVYYSNDDHEYWDEKLWNPVPTHYIVQRGFHSLPTPVLCKYIKLEFTNLAPTPYNPTESIRSAIIYRKFPSWVNEYFDIYYKTREKVARADSETFTVNPLDDYQNILDKLATGRKDIAIDPTTLDSSNNLTSVRDEVSVLLEEEVDKTDTESKIRILNSTLWQSSLRDLLDTTSALSRFILQGISRDWAAERPLPTFPAPTAQSVPDNTEVFIQRLQPAKFFPYTCRHSYQEILAEWENKIGYYVALKEVSFWQRDGQTQFDEPFYYTTLSNSDDIAYNDLIQIDWRFGVNE